MAFCGAAFLWANAVVGQAAENATDPVTTFRELFAEYEAAVEAGELVRAADLAGQAEAFAREAFGPQNPNTAFMMRHHGFSLAEMGDRREGRRVLRDALKLHEKLYGKQAEELLPVLYDLATHSDEYDQRGFRNKYVARYVKVAESVFGKDSLEAARASAFAGKLHSKNRSAKASLRYHQRAYDLYNQLVEPGAPESIVNEFELGRVQMMMGRDDEAEAHLLNVLDNLEAIDTPDIQLKLTAMAFLVKLYEESDRSSQATQYCLAIGEMTPVDDTQDYFPIFKQVPKYPYSALQSGRQGQVLIEFTVDPMGFTKNHSIVDRAGGKVFDNAALEAVREFRYAPRFVDGEPVATEGVQHIITFELVD